MGLRGYDAEHSPKSIVEVKNKWNCTSILPVCLHGMDRDNFTILLTNWLFIALGRSSTIELVSQYEMS